MSADAQQLEWEKFELEQLRSGICPGSGLTLMRRAYFDGPVDRSGPVMSCQVCDCFGYRPDEVGPTTPDLPPTERQS